MTFLDLQKYLKVAQKIRESTYFENVGLLFLGMLFCVYVGRAGMKYRGKDVEAVDV